MSNNLTKRTKENNNRKKGAKIKEFRYPKDIKKEQK